MTGKTDHGRKRWYSLAGVFMLVLSLSIPETAWSQSFMADPLIVAIVEDSYEGASGALIGGSSPNVRSPDGLTALYIAAQQRNSAIVKLLLEHGANPNLAARNGELPMSAAVQSGSTDVVALLLEGGANPERTGKRGETPLIKAVQLGHAEIVKRLLAAGADVNVTDYTGRTALTYAEEGRNRQLVTVLTEAEGGD